VRRGAGRGDQRRPDLKRLVQVVDAVDTPRALHPAELPVDGHPGLRRPVDPLPEHQGLVAVPVPRPTTGFDVVSLRAFSTAALRVIGRPNDKMTGIPTPYSCLWPSVIETLKTLFGFSVEKELVAVTVSPARLAGIAVTV
jgi:hypothetical protein